MNKIVVVDLGWGGLIFANDVYNNLSSYKNEGLEVIFIHMPIFKYNMSDDEKVKIFDAYLNDINKKFKPVVLVIACNTLAGLYKFTTFSNLFENKVINIIDIVCGAIVRKYKEGDNVIILASELTCRCNFYKNILIKKGIAPENITEIGLSGVASSIEKNLYSNYLNDEIINKIKEKFHLKKDRRNMIVLGCTHYEYIKRSFYLIPSLYGIDEYLFISGRQEMLKCFKYEYPIKRKVITIYSYVAKCTDKIKGNLMKYYKEKSINMALENERLLFID